MFPIIKQKSHYNMIAKPQILKPYTNTDSMLLETGWMSLRRTFVAAAAGLSKLNLKAVAFLRQWNKFNHIGYVA